MDDVIRLVTAEDNTHYRVGLNQILGEMEGVTLCGTAVNGKELLAVVEETQPHVVLTDVVMPVMSGIEATGVLRNRYPAIKVIALTVYSDEKLVVQMIRAGACGYLEKHTKPQLLLTAIRTVYEGGFFHCPSTALRISEMLQNLQFSEEKPEQETEKLPQFTTQELMLIRLVCEGYTNAKIARRMHLSENTIEKYLRRVQEKLGVKGKAGIVREATRLKLWS